MSSASNAIDVKALKDSLNALVQEISHVQPSATGRLGASSAHYKDCAKCINDLSQFFESVGERYGTHPQSLFGQHVCGNVLVLVLKEVVKPALTQYCSTVVKRAANAASSTSASSSTRPTRTGASSVEPSIENDVVLAKAQQQLRSDIVRPLRTLLQVLHLNLPLEPMSSTSEPTNSSGGVISHARSVLGPASTSAMLHAASAGAQRGSGSPFASSSSPPADSAGTSTATTDAASCVSSLFLFHNGGGGGADDADGGSRGSVEELLGSTPAPSLSTAPLLWKGAAPLASLCNHALEVLQSDVLAPAVGAEYALLLQELLQWDGYARQLTASYLLELSDRLLTLLERVAVGGVDDGGGGGRQSATGTDVVYGDRLSARDEAALDSVHGTHHILERITVVAVSEEAATTYAALLSRLFLLPQVTTLFASSAGSPFIVGAEDGEDGSPSGAGQSSSSAAGAPLGGSHAVSDLLARIQPASATPTAGRQAVAIIVTRLVKLTTRFHRSMTAALRLETHCVCALRRLVQAIQHDHVDLARQPIDVVKLLCDVLQLPHTERKESWRLEVVEFITVELCLNLSNVLSEQVLKDVNAAYANGTAAALAAFSRVRARPEKVRRHQEKEKQQQSTGSDPHVTSSSSSSLSASSASEEPIPRVVRLLHETVLPAALRLFTLPRQDYSVISRRDLFFYPCMPLRPLFEFGAVVLYTAAITHTHYMAQLRAQRVEEEGEESEESGRGDAEGASRSSPAWQRRRGEDGMQHVTEETDAIDASAARRALLRAHPSSLPSTAAPRAAVAHTTTREEESIPHKRARSPNASMRKEEQMVVATPMEVLIAALREEFFMGLDTSVTTQSSSSSSTAVNSAATAVTAAGLVSSSSSSTAASAHRSTDGVTRSAEDRYGTSSRSVSAAATTAAVIWRAQTRTLSAAAVQDAVRDAALFLLHLLAQPCATLQCTQAQCDELVEAFVIPLFGTLGVRLGQLLLAVLHVIAPRCSAAVQQRMFVWAVRRCLPEPNAVQDDQLPRESVYRLLSVLTERALFGQWTLFPPSLVACHAHGSVYGRREGARGGGAAGSDSHPEDIHTHNHHHHHRRGSGHAGYLVGQRYDEERRRLTAALHYVFVTADVEAFVQMRGLQLQQMELARFGAPPPPPPTTSFSSSASSFGVTAGSSRGGGGVGGPTAGMRRSSEAAQWLRQQQRSSGFGSGLAHRAGSGGPLDGGSRGWAPSTGVSSTSAAFGLHRSSFTSITSTLTPAHMLAMTRFMKDYSQTALRTCSTAWRARRTSLLSSALLQQQSRARHRRQSEAREGTASPTTHKQRHQQQRSHRRQPTPPSTTASEPQKASKSGSSSDSSSEEEESADADTDAAVDRGNVKEEINAMCEDSGAGAVPSPVGLRFLCHGFAHACCFYTVPQAHSRGGAAGGSGGGGNRAFATNAGSAVSAMASGVGDLHAGRIGSGAPDIGDGDAFATTASSSSTATAHPSSRAGSAALGGASSSLIAVVQRSDSDWAVFGAVLYHAERYIHTVRLLQLVRGEGNASNATAARSGGERDGSVAYMSSKERAVRMAIDVSVDRTRRALQSAYLAPTLHVPRIAAQAVEGHWLLRCMDGAGNSVTSSSGFTSTRSKGTAGGNANSMRNTNSDSAIASATASAAEQQNECYDGQRASTLTRRCELAGEAGTDTLPVPAGLLSELSDSVVESLKLLMQRVNQALMEATLASTSSYSAAAATSVPLPMPSSSVDAHSRAMPARAGRGGSDVIASESVNDDNEEDDEESFDADRHPRAVIGEDRADSTRIPRRDGQPRQFRTAGAMHTVPSSASPSQQQQNSSAMPPPSPLTSSTTLPRSRVVDEDVLTSLQVTLSVQCVQLLHFLLRLYRAGVWHAPGEWGGQEGGYAVASSAAHPPVGGKSGAQEASLPSVHGSVDGGLEELHRAVAESDVHALQCTPELFSNPTDVLFRLSSTGRLYYAVLWLCDVLTTRLLSCSLVAYLPLLHALLCFFEDVGEPFLTTRFACAESRQTVLRMTGVLLRRLHEDGVKQLSRWRPTNATSVDVMATVADTMRVSLDLIRVTLLIVRRTAVLHASADPLLDPQRVRETLVSLLQDEGLLSRSESYSGTAAVGSGTVSDDRCSASRYAHASAAVSSSSSSSSSAAMLDAMLGSETSRATVCQPQPIPPATLHAMPAITRTLQLLAAAYADTGAHRVTLQVLHTLFCRYRVEMLSDLLYLVGPSAAAHTLLLLQPQRERGQVNASVMHSGSATRGGSHRASTSLASFPLLYEGSLLERWLRELRHSEQRSQQQLHVNTSHAGPETQCAVLSAVFAVLTRSAPDTAERLGKRSFLSLTAAAPYVVRRFTALQVHVLFRLFSARSELVLQELLFRAREGILSDNPALCATSLLALAEAAQVATWLESQVLYTILECWATRGFLFRGLLLECMHRIATTTQWIARDVNGAGANGSSGDGGGDALLSDCFSSSFSSRERRESRGLPVSLPAYAVLCSSYDRTLLFRWLYTFGHPFEALPIACFGLHSMPHFLRTRVDFVLPLALLLSVRRGEETESGTSTASAFRENDDAPNSRRRRRRGDADVAGDTDGVFHASPLLLLTLDACKELFVSEEAGDRDGDNDDDVEDTVAGGEQDDASRNEEGEEAESSRDAKDGTHTRRGNTNRAKAAHPPAPSVSATANDSSSAAQLAHLLTRQFAPTLAQLVVLWCGADCGDKDDDLFPTMFESDAAAAQRARVTTPPARSRVSPPPPSSTSRDGSNAGESRTAFGNGGGAGAAHSKGWLRALASSAQSALYWMEKILNEAEHHASVGNPKRPARSTASRRTANEERTEQETVPLVREDGALTESTAIPVFDVLLRQHMDDLMAEIVRLVGSELPLAAPPVLQRAVEHIAARLAASQAPLESEADSCAASAAQDAHGGSASRGTAPVDVTALRVSPLQRVFLHHDGDHVYRLLQVVYAAITRPAHPQRPAMRSAQLQLLEHMCKSSLWLSRAVLCVPHVLHSIVAVCVNLLLSLPAAHGTVCTILLHVWPLVTSTISAPLVASKADARTGETASTSKQMRDVRSAKGHAATRGSPSVYSHHPHRRRDVVGGSDVTLASALLALSTEYPVIASTWTTLCRSDPQLTTLDWQLLSTTYTAESSQGFSSSARSHPEEEEEENEQRRVRASAAAVADATVIGVEGTESDSRLRERRSVPSTATDVDEDGEEGMDAAVDNPALPQDEASHCQVGSASLLNRVPCSSVCALLPRCSLLQRRKLRRLLPLLQSVHQVVGRAAAGFFRALSRAVDEEHTLFVQCIRAALALHANTREQRTKTMAATKNASSEAPLLCSTHRDTWLLSLRVFAVCQAAIARLFVIAQPLSSSVGSGASFSTLSTTAPSSTFSFGQSEENQLAALDAWRSLSWCLTEVREGGLVVLEQSCSGSACGVVVPLTCALPMLTVSQSSMHAGSALCDALWAASAPPPSSSDSSLSFVDEVIGRASGLFLAQLYTLTTHADPVVAGLASRTLRRWLAADSPYVAQQKKRGSAEGEAEEVGAVVDDVQLNAARRTARSAVKPTPPPPQGFSLSSTAISAASAQTTSSHASTTVCAEREVTAHDVALYALGWDTGAVQDHLHALSHPSGDAEEDDDDDDRSSGAGRVKTQKRLTGEDAVTGKEAGPSRGHGTKSLCLSEEGSTAAAGAAEARALLQPFCHPSSASSFSSVAAAAVPLGSPHWWSPLSALNALLRGERNCSATEPRMKQGNQPQPQASDEVDVSDALRRRQRSGAGRATGATGGGGNSGLGDAALWALLSVHHNERAFLPCFVLALLHTYGLCKRFTLLEATVPLLALEAHVAMLPSSPLAVPTAANGGVWWSGGGGSSTSEERGLGSAVHFSDTLLPIALSLVVTCKETEAQLRRRAEWSALLDTHLFRHAESFPRATRAVLRFLETVRIASMAMLRVYGVKGCSSVLTVTSSTAAPSNAEPFLEVQQGTSSGVSNLQSTCGLSRFGRLSQPTDVVESYWLRDIPAVHIARAALAVQEPALAAVFTELAGESALAPQSGIAIAQELTLAGLGSHHATSSSTLDGGGGGSAPAATATSAAATTSVTGGGAHGNVALDAAAVRQLHQRYSILFPQARPPASAAGTSASTSNSGGGRTASTAASPPPTSSVVASRAARAQAREADYTRRVMTLRARLFALYTKAAPLLPLDSFTTASLLSGSSGRGADTSTGWSSFTGVGSSGSGALQPPHNQQHQRGGDDDVHGGDVFDSIGSGMAWREALRAAEELEEEEGQDAVGEVRDTHRSVNCSVKRMLTEEDVESESDDDEADGNDERHSPVRGAPSTRPAVRALLQKAHLLVQAGLDRSAVELLLGGDDLLRQPRRRLRHCRVRGGAVVSEPPASVNGGHSESTADGLVWDWEAEVNEETTPTSALLTPPEEAAFRAVLAEAAWHCGRWGDDDRESLTGFLPLHHHPMHDAFTGGGGVGGRSGLPSLVDHHGGALSAVDVRVARRLFGEAQVYNEEQQQQQHGMTLSPSFHEGLLAGLLAIESGDVKGMLRHLRDAENAVQRQLHPTSWLSTLVAAQALHDVRLCGDARRPCGASAPSAAGLTHGAGTMGLLPSSSTSLPPYWVEELCTPPSANLSSRNDVASTTAMELTLPYTTGGGELLDRVRHALCQLYGRPDWWAASVKARSRRALRAHQPQLAYRWLRDFERFCTQQGVGASLVSTPVQQQHAQPPRTATVGGSETTNTSWLSDAMLTALALTQSEAVYELGRPGDALALLQRPPPPPSSSLPSFSSPLCSAARFALRLPASMATSPPVVRHVLGWYESLQLAPLSELVLDPFLSKSASTDDTGGCGFLLARLCHRLARDIVERVKSHEYQQMRESVAASKAARAALESETVQMKSLLNDQQANEVRKRLRQLQLDIEREEGELRTVASNYALYRRSALNSYARYLQLRHRRASTASATRKAQPNATTSVAHPTVQGVNVTSEEDVDAEEDELHAVFGFVSLWLDEEQQDAVLRERPDGSASSVTENVLRKALESIPAVSFLPLFAQLAARLGSGAEAERLSRLVLRVALAYPLHTVWPLLALSHGQEFGTARDARAVVFSWDDAKVSAATRVLKELKKSENAFTARAVTDAGRLSAAYIELAFEKPSSQSATRQHAIAGTARLLRDVQGLCIPPPTFTLPSALTSYPRSGISAGDGVEATEFSSMAIPCVMRFQSTYTTPGGINLPKVLRCELSTGETVRQLLKSKDDLRQDALIEQVFALSNTLFAKDEQARTLHVATYNVVPLAPVVGVLQWMEHTIPFGEYLTGSMSSGGGGSNGAAPFIGAHERYFPHEPTTSACRQKLNAAGKNEKESTLLQIYAEFTPAMHFFFMERCASAQMWLALQQSYTRSVAASSIVGYLVGLGDRHGSNLLIHLRSAELVHIDLGIAFDQNKLLPIPELVPFRLTRNIVDGFGVRGVDGGFRARCQDALHVLRSRRELLLNILDALVHDPLATWVIAVDPNAAAATSTVVGGDTATSLSATTDVKDAKRRTAATALSSVVPSVSDGVAHPPPFSSSSSVVPSTRHQRTTPADAQRALSRVAAKLSGFDGGNEQLAVPTQVHKLIQTAQNPKHLSAMFAGWSPWL